MATPRVVERFSLQRALGQETYTVLRRRPGSLAALRRLRAVHERLWALEDLARSARACDTEIAALKRQIDVKNGERHRLIDVIDQAVLARRVAPEPARCRRYSETTAEICDRLLILDLKAEHVARLSLDLELPELERARCRDKLAQQLARQAHVQACLREQLLAQDSGAAVLVPRGEFKLYNEPLLNPIMRKEQSA